MTFEDQASDGQTVVVDEVTMASGGFVVIHDSSLVGEVIGSVIGVSEYLEEGTHENVEITLDEPLEEDETLIAMAHRDTNNNQEFDFVESDGADDGPYEVAGELVTDDAVVTVDGESNEELANTEQSANTEHADNQNVNNKDADDKDADDKHVDDKHVDDKHVDDKDADDKHVDDKDADDKHVDDKDDDKGIVDKIAKPMINAPPDQPPVQRTERKRIFLSEFPSFFSALTSYDLPFSG